MRFTPKFFNPLAAGGKAVGNDGSVLFRAGRGPQEAYLYSPRILLALNVALAAERPLLISGEPGSGKTTLARNVAAVLGWWFYKQMVTSRIQAADLLSTFDALSRLNDANIQKADEKLPPKRYYVEPGRLWWAFSPGTARQRGNIEIPEKRKWAENPGTPPVALKARPAVHDKAVILLDEIDKADPDVPNDLLEPLDIKRFTVRETNDTIDANAKGGREVLLMMTTNGERELPPAFMRRCVSLTLDPPDEQWFVEIANHKYPKGKRTLHKAVARQVILHRAAARKRGLREPSTGEFLDALEVCRDIKIDVDSDAWDDVAMSVLWKHEASPDLTGDGEGVGGAGKEP